MEFIADAVCIRPGCSDYEMQRLPSCIGSTDRHHIEELSVLLLQEQQLSHLESRFTDSSVAYPETDFLFL